MLHKKYTNVDGDVIMHKLPKVRTVRAAWTHAILKGRKHVILERIHAFVTASLLVKLINLNPVFNKINPRSVR